MKYHKFNESDSLSGVNARRLQDEDYERRNREFNQLSEADDDFDGDEDAEEDVPVDDPDDLMNFDDEDVVTDDADDAGADDMMEADPTDYDCDNIARAVQNAVDKISAIPALTVKSFAGSVVVGGNKVDFRVRTSDGEITGISVEDIMPVAQIDANASALDNINGILSGSPEVDDEPIDERYF